jgi:phosphoglycerate dehydrogenase-like enzyme
MSWKVLITARVFSTIGKPALQALHDAGCDIKMADPSGPLSAAALATSLPGVDAVLASPDKYSAEVLASGAASSLKIISRWGVGYDSIDIGAATKQGIVVAFTPGMLNETVADWAWALLLGIARRVHLGHQSVTSGGWQSTWGHDVAGKTLGIIGCGRIGQAVARRARGFNMRVIGYDTQPSAADCGIEYVPLNQLLRDSDFVSLHAAFTPESRGMIGRDQLKQMKPSAYLINTARGPLIDDEALTEALKTGQIAGAALDVFSTEPLPADSVLRTAPNLLLTPHQASFARETGERVSLAAAEAIVDLLKGRKPRWVVDPNVFSVSNLRAKLNS